MHDPCSGPAWCDGSRVASGANSLVHFIPLLVASLLSRQIAWRIYRHQGRCACRIFGITLSLRNDNEGESDAGAHLYVWLNQASLTEAVVFSQLLPRWYTISNIEYVLMPLLGLRRPEAILSRNPMVRKSPGKLAPSKRCKGIYGT
jgi:hypothetical protein